MADEYQNLCDDLADEQAALDAVVAPLSDRHWSLLTPADGWTIRDTILHLAQTDAAAALAGCDPAGFDAYRRQRRTGLDPSAANADPPPSELLELWRANRLRLVECLRQISPKSRITWFGPPMSAMSHATARLMETWAHGQDVLDALGVQRADTTRLKHIAHLGVRTRAYSYTQHGLTPPLTDVNVELMGPDNAMWSWGDADAADHVMGRAGDFCLVVVRRRHLDDTRLEYSGPRAREWLLIAQAYAGAPGPGRQPGAFTR
jgi:uncharacterized protein (TIGR03084 family)